MAYAVGIVLALVVAGFARWTGFDRDRAFYPAVVVVVASYYVLFAAIGGSTPVLIVETLFMASFALLAVLGFKRSSWLAVAGLAGHGLFDAVHGFVVTNPGVPEWWPAFCAAFDVGIVGLLASVLVPAPLRQPRSRRPARAHGGLLRLRDSGDESSPDYRPDSAS